MRSSEESRTERTHERAGDVRPAPPERAVRFAAQVHLSLDALLVARRCACTLIGFARTRKSEHRAVQYLDALHSESGSNLIEVALVLPVYFLLVFTLISFAIVLFAYSNATYASKQAVRYAIVHGATSVTPCAATDLQNLITPYLWGAPPNGVTITSQWVPNNTVGSTVMVTVQMTYDSGLPYGYLKNLVVSTTAEGIIIH